MPLRESEFLTERFGSGDGERKTLLTRQIAFEPLPASVLFAPCWFSSAVHASALSELDGGSSTVHEVESRDSGAVVELDGNNAVAMVVSVKCANRRSS